MKKLRGGALSFMLLSFVLAACGGGGGGGDTSQGSGGLPIAAVSAPSMITGAGATLNGNVTPNGLATQAWFEWGTDAALSIFTSTTAQSIGDGLSAVAVVQAVSGCYGGTTYYFRVCGSNTKGTTKSSITTFTTSSPGAAPTVSTLAATSVSATGATLNANVTPNGLATTAWFEWGTDPTLTAFSTTPTQSVGSGTTSQLVSADLTGLSTGTTYYVRIAASNVTGTSRGTITSFTPGAAPTVSTLAATTVTATGATLNGNVTTYGLWTKAWFEWGTDPAMTTTRTTLEQVVDSGSTGVPVNAALSGLQMLETYYYRIAAENSNGISRGSIGSFTTSASVEGSIDTTFGGKGYVIHDNVVLDDPYGFYINYIYGYNNLDYSIAIDSSGRIVVAGCISNSSGNYDMAIWRYNSDGTLDASFGGTGIVTYDAGGEECGKSVVIDSSGRIVVTGYAYGVMAIWRYNSNGALDASFGGTGIVTHTSGYYGNSVVIDSSGRIVVTGSASESVMGIWRYNPNGTLDSSFGETGYVTYSVTADDTFLYFSTYFVEGKCLAIDSSGRIVVTGRLGIYGTYSGWPYIDDVMKVWRYNSDGTLDTSFGGKGYVNAWGQGGEDNKGMSIAIDSGGRIIVTGYSYYSYYYLGQTVIWRYNADGTLDTTFGGTGYVTQQAWGEYGNSVAIDSNGRIVVAGTTDYNYMTIWRYNTDGTLDTSFGGTGIVSPVYGFMGTSLAIDSSSRIVVTGLGINSDNRIDMVIWRFNP